MENAFKFLFMLPLICMLCLTSCVQDAAEEPVETLKATTKTETKTETETTTDPETELIRATLIDYIQGSTNGQPNRLKKAFHPDLNLYSIGKDGKLSIWSGTDYILDTKEGKPTGETGKILSVDYENNAAMAKVEIAHPKSSSPYIDYFMLLKIEGTWTIVHKMYTKKTSR